LNRPTWQSHIGDADPTTLGNSKGMYTFRDKASENIREHLDRWIPVAKKLMPAPGAPPLKPEATMEDAVRMVREMDKADIGTHIPEDGCWARADVIAMAIRRAGFEVVKVNIVAKEQTGDRTARLHVDTDNTPTGVIEWGYHVAPAVKVNGKLMVIDASMFDRPVTVDEWRNGMNAAKDAKTVVTSADQTWYGDKELSGEQRLKEFAFNLGFVQAVRRGYEPIRAHALVDGVKPMATAELPAAAPSPIQVQPIQVHSALERP
jgi:hypothetical protein